MIHRGIKCAQAIVLLFSFLLAFLFLSALDQQGVQGAQHLLLISDPSGSVSAEKTQQAVNDISKVTGASLGLPVPDLREAGKVRHLYLSVGAKDPERATWIAEGYPWFSHQIRTEVHPFSELGRTDPQGQYAFFGSKNDLDYAITSFQEIGYEVSSRDYYNLASIIGWIIINPVFPLAIMVALIVATMIGIDVVTYTKMYGIERLHGVSFWSIVKADLLSNVKSAAIGAVVATVSSLLLLYFYNSLHQISRFLLIAAWVIIVFTVLGVITHIFSIYMVSKMGLIDSLKGKTFSTRSMIAAYIIRFIATGLAIIMAVACLSLWSKLQHSKTDNDVWQSISQASFSRFNPDIPPEQMDKMAAPAGEWIRGEILSGNALLAEKDLSQSIFREDFLDKVNIILVDQQYLSRHPIKDIDGTLLISEANKINIAIPQSRVAVSKKVVPEIADWVESNSGNVVVASQEIPAEQRVFTYPTGDPLSEPFWDDPIIIIADKDLSFYSDENLMATATRRNVVFLDQNQAIASSAKAGFSNAINAFVPVSLATQMRNAEEWRDLRINLLTLAGSVLLLLVSSWGIAELYIRSNVQKIFVKTMHGWKFTAIHKKFLWIDIAQMTLFVLGVSLILMQIISLIKNSPNPEAGKHMLLPLGGKEIFVAFMVVILVGMISIVSCGILSRSFTKKHAAEA
ncbi:MAG: hypothetical protein ACRDAX_03895 [Propionibacteriaceae bacterium]